MEMYDLKVKPTGKAEMNTEIVKEHYPSFTIEGSNVPDFLDKLKVGENMVRCEVVLCKDSQQENQRFGNKSQGFSIYKIGLISDAGKKSKDEFLKMPKKERDQYNQDQMESETVAESKSPDEESE